MSRLYSWHHLALPARWAGSNPVAMSFFSSATPQYIFCIPNSLSASACQRTQLTNFSFNFLNNLVPNPSGQDKQDSCSPGRAALCGMSQPKQVEESVCTVGISSLQKEGIRVWGWLTLGFLNQSRVLRVSTRRSPCWSTGWIRSASMLVRREEWEAWYRTSELRAVDRASIGSTTQDGRAQTEREQSPS